jgi:pyruvate dehydrogenase E2 component (dihydrolipoamide acetyltransferase)
LNQVKGTGENGRIVKSDIENFTPAVAQPTADAPVVAKTETVVAPAAQKVFVPNGGCSRKKLRIPKCARSLQNVWLNHFHAPHYNLVIEVTMDDAMAARLLLTTYLIQSIFNDMVIKACAMALKNIKNQFTMERGCYYHQPSRQYWCCCGC